MLKLKLQYFGHWMQQADSSESEVAQSVGPLATSRTAAYQAPPSMGFSRQEYWSGLPLSSPAANMRRVQTD